MENLKIKTPKGPREIGPGNSTFIVAEVSGNHDQSFDKAIKIIDAAIDAGADAIKIQTYTADTLTINSDQEYFQIKDGPWKGHSLYSLYQQGNTPWEWHEKLKKHAESKGVVLFSSPFDATAVDFLEKLGVELYKIAGYEMADIPLLRKVAQTGKPIIMSAAMASADEVQLSVETLRKYGSGQIAVLHCVETYPAALEDMNVATVADIIKRYNVVSGLSDHSLSNTASIASVALGGSIIEKHVTLRRADVGHDSAFSLEPQEFKQLVDTVREVEKSIGIPTYGVGLSEIPQQIFKRSLFVVADVKKGEVFTEKNIRSIRPGNGLAPKYYDAVVGKTASKDIVTGTPLDFSLINEKVTYED